MEYEPLGNRDRQVSRDHWGAPGSVNDPVSKARVERWHLRLFLSLHRHMQRHTHACEHAHTYTYKKNKTAWKKNNIRL